MAVTNSLLSVADFAALPQPPGGARQELHHGELFELPPVKKRHTELQRRLVKLLEGNIDPAIHGVDKEFPFSPQAEHEVWIADVAIFSLAQWAQTADDDYFRGVPAIVIEVLSPSNTASEMMEREHICLSNGGQEFWLVDPNGLSFKVTRANGASRYYDAAAQVESTLLLAPIQVRDILA